MNTPDNDLDIHDDGITLVTLSNMWSVSFEMVCSCACLTWASHCYIYDCCTITHMVAYFPMKASSTWNWFSSEIILLQIQCKLHVLPPLTVMILLEWNFTKWEIDSCAVAWPITVPGAKPWSIPATTPKSPLTSVRKRDPPIGLHLVE